MLDVEVQGKGRFLVYTVTVTRGSVMQAMVVYAIATAAWAGESRHTFLLQSLRNTTLLFIYVHFMACQC